MSSLEERREARRRKRMQEEAGDSNRNDLVNSSVRDEQIKATLKRQLKEDRLSRLATSETVEEDTSSRRSRRRPTEDEPAPEPQEAPAEEPSQEDAAASAAAAAAAAEAAAAEEERKRQENEERRKKEAEERERREAEDAKKKIEEEKRAAEDAVRRQAEDEKNQKEEEERKKREAEERRKRINESYKQLVTKETSNSCDSISYHYNIKREITYAGSNEDNEDDEKEDDDEEEEEEDDDDCDSDFEEGPEKSDTSLELQNHNGNSDDSLNQKTNSFCSPVKDSFESSAEIRVSTANLLEDSGQLSATILNDMYPKVANDDYTYQSSNLSETRESTSPDSGKFSFLSVHTNHMEPVPWLKDPKQPDYQTNKRHGTPEKSLIPNRGSNLKDIQKKFEAVSKQEPKEFGKRNINLQENGLISSFKAPSRTPINSVSIKDYKSKLESSLSDSKTKLQSYPNKLSTESEVKNKNTSILEDLTNSKNKNVSDNNSNNNNNDNNRYYNNNNNIINKNNNNNNSGLKTTEKTVKVCNKWPPEKAIKVHDISKSYNSETNSSLQCEPEAKLSVLVSQKSVVKRWPHAQIAQISMAKRPEKLMNWSPDVNGKGTIAQQLNYKTDVRGRWPPEVDLKQTARESISSALAQKIYKPPSKDVTDVLSENLRKDIINETAVAQVFLQTPENTRLKEGTFTCKIIPKSKENNELNIPHHSYHNGHLLETKSSLFTNLHAVKEQNLSYTSFVPSTNQHPINDDDDSGDEAKGQTVSSAHCIIHLQSGTKEEEEREEAERKKRQEEPSCEARAAGEKMTKLTDVSQLNLDDTDEETRKKLILSQRIVLLPDNLEELSKAQLQDLVKKLHSKMAELEEEVYDWEFKIRRQEFEINDLTIKVNDTRGKFVKPVLRKVSKTEAKLAKLERKKAENFRPTLKSTHESQKEEDGQAEE